MNQIDTTRGQEPIRLFKSDLLEFFTHIHPAVVLILWAPVAIYFLVRAIAGRATDAPPLYIPSGFLTGLFVWTFTEYAAHRFLFHYRPRTRRQERVLFLFHGVHHAQPHSKTRLVMPPVVSLPLAVLFYVAFRLILGTVLGAPQWVPPLFSGFVAGYLAYDMLHYATHHFPMRRGYWKYLKRYHMQHHFKTPNQRFGVSSPLWDAVFKTKPADVESRQPG
jgi:sterol desaturase/sphingolipid hydroxylase (fatty acid hydroxylase superfamily)